MKKQFSAVGCGRMWKEKAEMERLKEEAEQEEGKSGKRELDRERRGVDIKRSCLDRVSGEVLEDFSPVSEVEGVVGFRCVCLLCLFPCLM